MASKTGSSKKSRTSRTSRQERRSSKPVTLTEVQKINLFHGGLLVGATARNRDRARIEGWR